MARAEPADCERSVTRPGRRQLAGKAGRPLPPHAHPEQKGRERREERR